MITRIKQILKCYLLEKKFRQKNKHNNIKLKLLNHYPIPIDSFEIDYYSYGKLNVISFGHPLEKLKVGRFCSIAPNCTFILSGEHKKDCLLTYPTNSLLFRLENNNLLCKGEIIVEDDVWLGYGVTILSGVTIGKGSIIGAGTVISKNIEPYSIVVGNPCRVIKKRFSDEIIEKLLSIDYKEINLNSIKQIQNEEISDNNIDNIISMIKGE